MKSTREVLGTRETQTAALILLSTIIIYLPLLTWLLNEYLRNPWANHGLIVPVAATYILYKRLKDRPIKISQSQNSTILGALIIFVAVCVRFLSGSSITAMTSLILYLLGATILFYGTALFSVSFPALLYLLFMYPIDVEVLYSYGTSLSISTGKLSRLGLAILGIPVSYTENPLPIFTVSTKTGETAPFMIDVPCMGAQQVIGYIAFAVFLMLITEKPSLVYKGLSFALGLLLMPVLNVLRVIAILLIAYEYGVEAALTTFHTFGGWVLFTIGILVYLVLIDRLSKRPSLKIALRQLIKPLVHPGKIKTALLILLITTSTIGVFSQSTANVETTTAVASTKPVAANTQDVDKNQNKIEDALEAEMREKIAEGKGTQLAPVVVLLNAVPTQTHASRFRQLNGTITHGPWRHALYGFGGKIPYLLIAHFAEKFPNLLLIQKDHEYHALMAYAARQGRARTYVWDTLGYKGDSNSAIAISDTGIDETHLNHLGYGDADFTKKIVGWRDDVGTGTTPYDDNGHGSHCAGIAAGSGFYTTDADGRSVATWSGAVSLNVLYKYLITGFNVTRSGGTEKIILEVKSSGVGPNPRVDTIYLDYAGYSGDTGTWTTVRTYTISTPDAIETFEYAIPSGKIGYYHIWIHGNGDAYLLITTHWTYDPPSDGYSAWTGVANQAKLVGVKGLDAAGYGSTTDLVNGINWVIENRQTYHILVLSMSWGGTTYDSAINTAVTNAVSSGIVCVAAAGNAGSGGNYIHSPGSNPYAITIAATSLTDNVTSYSSQGGTSEAESTIVKPDICAPGGSFYMLPMFSSDSNDYDADNHYADYYANDSAPMQGTSMSTPFIAGCADIVAQALGGHSAWNYTSNAMALKVKMLLLMTATETYPLLRERKTSADSPTLERGGKDVHEGYGRVNLDAAVEAASIAWDPAITESATLYAADYYEQYRDAAIYRHAWARKITLAKDYNYSFVLDVPSTGDFDLYIYSETPNTYGEPVIKWSSTQAGVGVDENIATGYLTAEEEGTYYFVVKAVSGYGTFSTGYAMPPVYIPELPIGTVVALVTALIVAVVYRRWRKSALPGWLKTI